jgi:phytoene desaturase
VIAARKVIVIGAGVAGLATACRLRAKGFEVLVVEANAYPGGKLTEIKCKGYRFDAGPSLFTMPHYLDDVFHTCHKNPRDYYNYQKLATTCHYFYEDGTQVNAYGDTYAFTKEVELKLAVPASTVVAYLKKSAFLYQKAAHIFLENSLHKVATWCTTAVAKALPFIFKLGLFETMHERNTRLLKEKRLIQLFNRYATYNGSDPYQAPGILTSIPHLEFNIGAYLPEGGMHTITQSLYTLANEMGVIFTFNSTVNEICYDNKSVTGILTADGFMKADIIVSNMDVFHTYRKLLPRFRAPEKILSQERSSSALIFYWGIKKEFPQLDLHNIFFSSSYEAEFRALFKTKTLYDDPTVYINITSKYCKADAPQGCENWFVMINVPANTGQDWEEIIRVARARILQKISRLLQTEISTLIATEEILDPRLIESRTSSYQGSLYGTSSNNKYAAFLRHANFSKNLKNLFFCGGSAHPGGGIPLCLQSGRITADIISKQFAGFAV